MKTPIEELHELKEKRRRENAARSIAEKLRVLDRLKERNEQIKRARPVLSGPK